jgi:hypothetical protein
MESDMKNNLVTATMVAGVALAVLSANATYASANNFCDAKLATYRGELDAKVAPVLIEIDANIENIRKSGGDPEKIAVKMDNGSFKTLPEIRAMIISQKDEVSQQIDKAASDCSSDLKPFQDVIDAAVTAATGGLNKILPERMTHIEIGEILGGKPFGGDGAIVPHLREQVLGMLGLKNDRGFVTTFIRDPLHAIWPHL